MPDFRKSSPTVMLVCASLILTLALGIRHGFGLFLQPMSMDNGWGREVFGFAVALQNLALVLITGLGWYSALIALSLLVAVVMPASFGVADKGYHGTLAAGVSLKEALAEAFRHRGFWLLGVGYFACGFQVVFIGT